MINEEPRQWICFKTVPLYFWLAFGAWLFLREEWVNAIFAFGLAFTWSVIVQFYEIAIKHTLDQQAKMIATILLSCYTKPGLQVNDDGTISPKEFDKSETDLKEKGR